MIAAPLKAIGLAILGFVIVIGGAYFGGFFEPPAREAPPQVASVPPAGTTPAPAPAPAEAPKAGEPSAPAAPGTPPAAALPGSSEPAQPGASAPASPPAAASDAPAAPTFDVVRVEGGGSVVIAGKAPARAAIEILTGASIIGRAKAGPEGDFAAVLDEPLKPGEYQIALRATLADGTVLMSAQTALVSIPATESGEVLALVEEPGKASELITIPEPSAPAAPAPVPPAAAAVPGTGGAAAPTPAPDAPGTSAGTTPAPADPASPPAQPPSSAEVAAVTPPADAAPVAPTPPVPPAGLQVSVQAVEIEGNRVFVAGIATPGKTVRVYANQDPLGEATVSPVGRFLVEAIRDLPVGDYIIRADLLDADGRSVLARAAVPFQREAGEAVAAVAPPSAPAEAKPVDPANPVPQPAQPGVAPAPGEENAGASAPGASAPAGSAPAGAGGVANGGGSTAPADASTPPASEPGKAPEIAAAEPGAPAAPAGGARGDAAEVTAPKLQGVNGAVIIRRGDTLWRISRRVYGRGVRYSTIYLANQTQIEDPNRIWPGQVFSVPDKTNEGEAADIGAMGEQAVPVPTPR